MQNILESDIFKRSSLLLGEDVMASVAGKRVIIFGVGGVGSWCAEGLVRDGIRHLTLVDVDVVGVTNINRQLQATVSTIGEAKVEALKRRLVDINPNAEIEALCRAYNSETAESFDLNSYDYVIDAIDSLKDKMTLILEATSSKAVFFSAMGAALKVDPTQIRVAEFWDVCGCPLGSMLRKRLRQRKRPTLRTARRKRKLRQKKTVPERSRKVRRKKKKMDFSEKKKKKIKKMKK